MFRIKEIERRADVGKFFRPFGIGAELGVETGANAVDLLKACKPKKMYLVDWWSFQADARGMEDWKHYGDGVRSKFASEVSTGQVEIVDGNFESFLSKFPDEFFDWIYLDGWHQYEHVSRDILQAARKVKVGGIFGGHDFKVEPGDWDTGVPRAVIELIQGGYGPMIGLSNESNADWLIKRGGFDVSVFSV